MNKNYFIIISCIFLLGSGALINSYVNQFISIFAEGNFQSHPLSEIEGYENLVNTIDNQIIGGIKTFSNKIVMEDSTSSSDDPTTISTKGYVDTEIARIESLVTGSLPLVFNVHTREACVSLGGVVVDSDVSLPICRFNQATCPSNWTKYKNYRTSQGGTVTYYTKGKQPCGGESTCYSSSGGCNCTSSFGPLSWGNNAYRTSTCICSCVFCGTCSWCNGESSTWNTQIGCY